MSVINISNEISHSRYIIPMILVFKNKWLCGIYNSQVFTWHYHIWKIVRKTWGCLVGAMIPTETWEWLGSDADLHLFIYSISNNYYHKCFLAWKKMKTLYYSRLYTWVREDPYHTFRPIGYKVLALKLKKNQSASWVM